MNRLEIHSRDGPGKKNVALARLRSGWRDYMEDFHFALPTLGGEWSDTAAFAVLDGHGGFDTSAFADQNHATF